MVVAIIIIAVVLVAAAVGFAVMQTRRRREERTKHLRGTFGPEYERTLDRTDGRKEAEADLERRAEQREALQIRELSPESRERFAAGWQQAQQRFVDSPAAAIADADALVREVMAERGYPVHDFDRRADDLSVDHPHLVENFRGASDIARRSEREDVSTEDQRQAMMHYRSLFDELLGAGGRRDGAVGRTTEAAAPREQRTATHEQPTATREHAAPREQAPPPREQAAPPREQAAPAPGDERLVGERPVGGEQPAPRGDRY